MSRANRGSSGPVEALKNNVVLGGAIGAAAYVVNYVLTFVFVSIDGVEGEQFESWQYTGNLLYNAHFVDTEISGGGGSDTTTFFEEAGENADLTSTVPEVVYYAVPIIVLLVAGFLVARRVQSRLDTVSAAATGASILPGYLVLAVVGTFAFEAEVDIMGSTTTYAPDLIPAVLIVGIAFPLVLGAIGGAVANEV